MISKGTTDWMERTILDGVSLKARWLVPQNGVNGGTIYEERPVGNSPDLCRLISALRLLSNGINSGELPTDLPS